MLLLLLAIVPAETLKAQNDEAADVDVEILSYSDMHILKF